MIWAGSDNVAAMRDTRSCAVLAEPPALRSAPPRTSDGLFEYPVTKFSADGSRLGVRTVQKSLVLLDGRTGERIGEEILDVDVGELHFSPGGRFFISHQSTPRDGAGAALEAASGRRLRVRVNAWSDDTHFNSQGTRALVLSDNGWTLIDPPSGQELARGGEEDISFVGDGPFVLARQGHRARLIDAQAGRLLVNLGELARTNGWVAEFGLQLAPDRHSAVSRAPTGPVLVAPDGAALLSSDDDGMELWDLKRRKLLMRRAGDVGGDDAVSSDDGALLALKLEGDGEFELWNARTGAWIATLGQAWRAAFVRAGSGEVLIVQSGDVLAVWDARRGEKSLHCSGYTNLDDLRVRNFGGSSRVAKRTG